MCVGFTNSVSYGVLVWNTYTTGTWHLYSVAKRRCNVIDDADINVDATSSQCSMPAGYWFLDYGSLLYLYAKQFTDEEKFIFNRQARENSVDPDQTPQYAGSDQGLLSLPLIE